MKLKKLILAMALAPLMALANETYTDEEGHDWLYTLNEEGEATILRCPEIDNVIVPREIDGHPVVAFSSTLNP